MCTKVCFAARAASCKRGLIFVAQTLLLRNACVLGSGARDYVYIGLGRSYVLRQKNSRDILRPQIRTSGRYIIMPQYTDPDKWHIIIRIRTSGRYFLMPQYTDPDKRQVFLDSTIYGSGQAADNNTDPDKRQVFLDSTIYGYGQAAYNNTDPDKRQVYFDATIYGSGQAAGIFGFHNIRIRTSGR